MHDQGKNVIVTHHWCLKTHGIMSPKITPTNTNVCRMYVSQHVQWKQVLDAQVCSAFCQS